MLIHVCVHVCVLVCVAAPVVVGAWSMAGALRQLFEYLYYQRRFINLTWNNLIGLIILQPWYIVISNQPIRLQRAGSLKSCSKPPTVSLYSCPPVMNCITHTSMRQFENHCHIIL